MNKMTLSRVAALLLAGYLACSFAAGVFVADGAVHPIRRPLFAQDEKQVQQIAHTHQSDLSDVLITAADGAILKGWSFRPHNSNEEAVILFHGLSDNRLGMVGYAEMLLDHGFSVLMPDARAHGESGGQIARKSYAL
jgi:predicted alpha/beta-fold hydrolase